MCDTMEAAVDVASILCEANDGKVATKQCDKCNVFYCDQCSESHTKLKLFKEHVLQDIATTICPTHHRKFVLICEKCPKLLCILCHNKTCTDHDQFVFEIEEVSLARKLELKTINSTLIGRMQTQYHKLKPLLDDLQRQQQQLDNDEKIVVQHKNKIIEKAEKECEVFLNVFSERREILLELQKQLDEQDNNHQLLKNLVKASNAALINSQTTEMLMEMCTIKKSIPVEIDCDSIKLPPSVSFYKNDIVSMGTYEATETIPIDIRDMFLVVMLGLLELVPVDYSLTLSLAW